MFVVREGFCSQISMLSMYIWMPNDGRMNTIVISDISNETVAFKHPRNYRDFHPTNALHIMRMYVTLQ